VAEKIGLIAERLQTINPGKVIVSSSFSEALLIPQKYAINNFNLLDTIYDHADHSHLQDNVAEWQICTSYAIPDTIHKLLLEKFPSVQFFHVYTPLIKVNTEITDNHIIINFTTENFRVLVKNNNQVQLVQTYIYKTPLDVIYYLLKICYEFGLNQSEIVLIISGLVDADSSLYEELRNYFLTLHFPDPPSFSLPKNDHPHYFFTSLYNLAECAL
jgi:uncharacterized protein DUF3822